MSVVDRLRRHRQELELLGEALDAALEIIDRQADVIAALTRNIVNPASSEVTLERNPMLIGATSQASIDYLKADGSPDSAPPGTTVAWSSDNDAVATVDASGLVTGVSAGNATIAATSTFPDGTTQVESPATATVTAPDPASGQVVLA